MLTIYAHSKADMKRLANAEAKAIRGKQRQGRNKRTIGIYTANGKKVATVEHLKKEIKYV